MRRQRHRRALQPRRCLSQHGRPCRRYRSGRRHRCSSPYPLRHSTAPQCRRAKRSTRRQSSTRRLQPARRLGQPSRYRQRPLRPQSPQRRRFQNSRNAPRLHLARPNRPRAARLHHLRAVHSRTNTRAARLPRDQHRSAAFHALTRGAMKREVPSSRPRLYAERRGGTRVSHSLLRRHHPRNAFR